MSAEKLRAAVRAIREDYSEWDEAEFERAVADWLEMYAVVLERLGHPLAFTDYAVAVARAYLGESV